MRDLANTAATISAALDVGSIDWCLDAKMALVELRSQLRCLAENNTRHGSMAASPRLLLPF